MVRRGVTIWPALCTCIAVLQDQVGLSLVHLLGDTETLAQTQAPHPVTLQELCDQNKVSASVRCGSLEMSCGYHF
jgi:hypothetical protein